MQVRNVAVVGGDGIGPEVMAQAVRLLEELNRRKSLKLRLTHMDWGAERWLRERVGLPPGALDELRRDYEAILFGALGDKRIPDMAPGRCALAWTSTPTSGRSACSTPPSRRSRT